MSGRRSNHVQEKLLAIFDGGIFSRRLLRTQSEPLGYRQICICTVVATVPIPELDYIFIYVRDAAFLGLAYWVCSGHNITHTPCEFAIGVSDSFAR